MRISGFTAAFLFGGVLMLNGAAADEGDPCAQFRWDVLHELSIMKRSPLAMTAGLKGAGNTAQLHTEQLYEVKLAPQGTVAYVLAPGKPAPDDNARGGLVNFRVATAGLYRISLSSSHWIDVVADGKFIKSRDFQGAHGCERPHKIVEFELPADRWLTLQLSGAAAPAVLVSITAVATPPAH